ncbi:MAG: IS630 transposase-related protein [Nitrospirales bacterium]
MLTTSTIQQAAKKAKVAEATIRRWLKREDFASAYRETRRRNFESALSRLQVLSSSAVDTLRRNLNCGSANAEVRAAAVILDRATDAADLFDLVARLEAVERSLHEKEHE